MAIIDRSPPALVDDLCKRIDSILRPSFWFEAEKFDDGDNEDYHTPHVHAQYLPITTTGSAKRDKTKDFPIVQVVCVSGTIVDFEDVMNGSEMTIQIHFGGYSKDLDNQGWRIPMAMMWHVIRDLLSNTIIGGYKLDTPIKWTPINSKEPPYYTAMLETVWKGSPPAVEIPTEEIYGNESDEIIPTEKLPEEE